MKANDSHRLLYTDPLESIVDKVINDIEHLDDLMPSPHTKRQYIKSIIQLYEQYKQDEERKLNMEKVQYHIDCSG